MKIDHKKLARQNYGIDKWFNANCVGIWDWATGVGKTYAATLAIKKLMIVEEDLFTIIIVPGKELKSQWITRLQKEFYKKEMEYIRVFTIHEILDKDIQYQCGLCVIDEVHEFHTDERIKVINKTLVRWEYFLGLTASGDDKKFYIVKSYIKIIDHISEEEALEKEYITPFIEYNLALTLSDIERKDYDKYTLRIGQLMPRFNKDIGLAQKVLSGGKDKKGRYYIGNHWALALARKNGWREDLDLRHESNLLLDESWNPRVIIGYARKLLTSVRNRKELLSRAESKLKASLELLTKFNKIKTIVFSESTSFADDFYKLCIDEKENVVIYHSNLKTIIKPSPITGKPIKFGKTRLKREAIESIKTGKARAIITAKSLDRGFDVQDIRFGLITSSTQNHTQQKQRTGRVKRKEEIFANVTVLLVNLYIKDTQDEIWLNKKQSKTTHEIINVTTIEDINYFPPSNQEFLIDDI